VFIVKPWKKRPIEEANLFNPAFCGEVLRRAIGIYNGNSQNTFPYPLVFLVLPIVLYRKTREVISPRTQEQLHVWLQNNPSVRVGFAERAKSLVPITNESLNFLLQINNVILDDTAGLCLRYNLRQIRPPLGDEEIRDCFKKGEIVGRWFARAGSVANIYTMWGVKP
jgi:hypothetical protein